MNDEFIKLVADKIADKLNDRLMYDKFKDNIDKSHPLVFREEKGYLKNLEDSKVKIRLNTDRKVNLILIYYSHACVSSVDYVKCNPIKINDELFYPFDFSSKAIAFEVDDYLKYDSILEINFLPQMSANIYIYFYKK